METLPELIESGNATAYSIRDQLIPAAMSLLEPQEQEDARLIATKEAVQIVAETLRMMDFDDTPEAQAARDNAIDIIRNAEIETEGRGYKPTVLEQTDFNRIDPTLIPAPGQ